MKNNDKEYISLEGFITLLKHPRRAVLIAVLGLILASAFVPLIYHLKIVHIEGNAFEFWMRKNISWDFFAYHKANFIIISALIIISAFVLNYDLKQLSCKKHPVQISLFIFAVCTILSTIFSEYRDLALEGFPERYEGMLVLISYVILCLGALTFCTSSRTIKTIMISLTVSATVLAILGLFQFYGYDFWKTEFGQNFMLSGEDRQFLGRLTYTKTARAGINPVSLYNSNYSGSYFALAFSLSAVFFAQARSLKNFFFFGVLAALFFANLYASGSRGSMISVLISLAVISFLLRKDLLHKWKPFLILLTILALAAYPLSLKKQTVLLNFKQGLQQVANLTTSPDSQVFKLIRNEWNKLRIVTTNETLVLTTDGKQVFFLDEDLNFLPFRWQGKNLFVDHPRYSNYRFQFYEQGKILNMKYKDKYELNFLLKKDGIFIRDSRGNQIEANAPSPSIYVGGDKLFSGRGFVWSRTLPLLKNVLFLGNGPDTFPAYFPQNDVVGKLNAFDNIRPIITNPHNMYLQTILSSGFISLLALLFAFGYYIRSSIRLYNGTVQKSFMHIAGLACFAGFLTFCITGFVNDSTVLVAPVFWVIFGMGAAINITLQTTGSPSTKSENKP